MGASEITPERDIQIVYNSKRRIKLFSFFVFFLLGFVLILVRCDLLGEFGGCF